MEQVTKICEKCKGEGEIPTDIFTDHTQYHRYILCVECMGWGYVKVEKTKQIEPEYYI